MVTEEIVVHSEYCDRKKIESLPLRDTHNYDMYKDDLVSWGLTDFKFFEYEYDAEGVGRFVEEKGNPKNPGVVAVYVNDIRVAYLSIKDAGHFRRMKKENHLVQSIDVEVFGGRYVMLTDEYDSEKDKIKYYMHRGRDNYWMKLTVHYS